MFPLNPRALAFPILGQIYFYIIMQCRAVLAICRHTHPAQYNIVSEDRSLIQAYTEIEMRFVSALSAKRAAWRGRRKEPASSNFNKAEEKLSRTDR